MCFFSFFVFFVRYLGFCFLGIFGDPTFSAIKNKNKKPIRKRLGKGTLNTCTKFQGLTLKNGVDIWTFVRLSAKITAWHRNYLFLVLVLVYNRFRALKLTYCWSYAVNSSIFCAKLSTNMP